MDLSRYYEGNDGWNFIAEALGIDAAGEAADAARRGDITTIARILKAVNDGAYDANATGKGGTSTWGNFWQQITTDPLGAPLDSLNNQLKTVFRDLLKNPFVLIALAGLVFWAVGGFDWLKRKINP